MAVGGAVLMVGLYAAHPSRQGHGSALLEELMLAAPDNVWLLASAASPALAQRYARYGFRSWDPERPLLLERPPGGASTAGGSAVPGERARLPEEQT